MMFAALRRLWSWFIEGLTEALLYCLDALQRRGTYRLDLTDAGPVLVGPSGKRVGHWIREDETLRFEPQGSTQVKALAAAGLAVDITIPGAWMVRRGLDPVAVASAPFLDAFVRHHIERITPWRVGDVHYRILRQPLPGDPTRLDIAVAVVPKRVVQEALDAVAVLRPKVLRLVPLEGESAALPAISLGGQAALRLVRWRQNVAVGVVLLLLGAGAGIGWVWWEASAVADEISAEDDLIAARKRALAAAGRQNDSSNEREKTLQALRASRPRVVDIIEALSAALPDTASLTALTIDKALLTVSGVSAEASQLVPSLETSGNFADVAFSAATTRLETGQGDRFHLTLRALPRRLAANPEPATVGAPAP